MSAFHYSHIQDFFLQNVVKMLQFLDVIWFEISKTYKEAREICHLLGSKLPEPKTDIELTNMLSKPRLGIEKSCVYWMPVIQNLSDKVN